MFASSCFRPGRGRRTLGFVLACLLAGASPGALGATITVDTLEDHPAGTTGQGCTLRDAIVSANTDTASGDCASGAAGEDTVQFDSSLFELDNNNNPVALTVDLTVREQLTVTAPLTVNGRVTSGDDDVDVTVDALGNLGTSGDSDNFTCDDDVPIRIFHIQADTTLNHLNLTGGCATDATPSGPQGGAILLSGAALTLDDVNITNSLALDDSVEDSETGAGGGIFIDAGGTLVMTGSSVRANTVGTTGGGIANVSTALIGGAGGCPLGTDAPFSGDCTIALEETSIGGNVAGDSNPDRTIFGRGGGLHNGADATVAGRVVTFNGNAASASGGGIWNAGTGSVELLSATLQNHRARALDDSDAVRGGGAIFNDGGDLTIEFATFRQNGILSSDILETERSMVHGGGVASTGGTLSFDTVAFTQNQAGQPEIRRNSDDELLQQVIPGLGGALYVDAGSLTVLDSTFFSNLAQTDGGAVWHGGDGLDMQRTTVQSNDANGGDEEGTAVTGGGGLYNEGPATIVGGRFYRNRATGENSAGGGILNTDGGSLTVEDAEIGLNDATSGAGIDNGGTLTLTRVFLGAPQFESRNVARANGGGLHNRSAATATVDDSTIAFNDAADGGGIWNEGSLTVTNSTFSDNRALGDSEADGSGGGLFQAGGSATLDFVTVTESSATGNGGGIGVADGQSLTLNSSLVARNSAEGSDADTTAGVTASDSFVGEDNPEVDPAIDPLKLYGGPLPTHPLLAESPAVDFVLAGDCTEGADQRGATRPFDGDDDGTADCDAGSFERTDDPVLVVASNRPRPPDKDTVTIELGQDLAVLGFSVTNNGTSSVTIDGFNVQPLFNGGIEALRQLVLNDPEEADLVFEVVLDNGAGGNAGNGSLDDDETTVVGSGDGRTFDCIQVQCSIAAEGGSEDFLIVLRMPEQTETAANGWLSAPPIFAGGLLIGLLGLVRLRGLRRRAQWLLVVALLTGGLAACSDSTSIDDVQPPRPPQADPSLQGHLRFKLFQLTSDTEDLVIGDGLPVYGPAISVL